MLESCKIIEFTSGDQELHKRSVDIRYAVWIQEKQAPVADCLVENEDNSVHFLLTYEGKDIASSRFRLMHEGYKIERVNVLKEYREKGLGTFLIKHIIKRAQEVRAEKQGDERIMVHSIADAFGFWGKIGFVTYGEPYMEAGIPHRSYYYDENESK